MKKSFNRQARNARYRKMVAEGKTFPVTTAEDKTRLKMRYLSKLRLSQGKRLWTPEFRAEMEQVTAGQSVCSAMNSLTELLERFEAA